MIQRGPKRGMGVLPMHPFKDIEGQFLDPTYGGLDRFDKEGKMVLSRGGAYTPPKRQVWVAHFGTLVVALADVLRFIGSVPFWRRFWKLANGLG